MKEMVEVFINRKTGKITISDIDSHYAVQGLYCYCDKESGPAYHCEKGTEDKYIKKMFEDMLEDLDNDINKLEKQRNKLHAMYDKYLTESKET